MELFYYTSIICALLSSTSAGATPKHLTYIKAHTLRVSAAEDLRDWILPLPEPLSHRPYTVRLHSFLSRNNEVPGFYEEISKRQRALLEERLARSYGHPYDAAIKAALKVSMGPFSQSIAANAGAAFVIHDPVFPEIDGLIFNDFTAASAYEFQLPYRFRIRPQLINGLRRILEERYTAGQLVDRKPNTKLNTFPYKYFSELNLDIARRFDFFEVFLNFNSLPIKHRGLIYWDSNLGVRSANLIRMFHLDLPAEATFWASTSPFYGGDYSFARTVKIGLSSRWFNVGELDLFLSDNYHLGVSLGLQIGSVGVFAFSFGRSDDDYGIFFSRQYGAGVNIQF